MDRSEFATRALILLLLAGLAWAVLALADLLLLVFGATLVAVVLRALADLVARSGLGQRWSMLVSLLLLTGVAVATTWLGTAYLADDMSDLARRLPQAWERLRDWLEGQPWGEQLVAMASDAKPDGSRVLRGTATAMYATTAAAGELLLVVFGGIYIAMRPRLYRHGIEQLLPAHAADTADRLLDAEAVALRLWLKGQLISMAVVGVLTATALWLVGVPGALALGLIAGLAEFVPFVGPVVAAIPALLIASTVDGSTLLLTLAVYVGVQQVESNIIMPMVEQRTVALPPALTIFAVVAAGILFGPIGVLLGTPLSVAAFVLVKQLWVHDALGRPADLPGRPPG